MQQTQQFQKPKADYYNLIQRHLSPDVTDTVLKELKTRCQGDKYSDDTLISIIKFKNEYFLKQKFDYQCSQITLNEEDSEKGKLDLVINKVFAYVFYRIYYNEKKKKKVNIKDKVCLQFLEGSTDIITNEKYRKDRKNLITLLSFLLNYSRGLVDFSAIFMKEFSADMSNLNTILEEDPNSQLNEKDFIQIDKQHKFFHQGIKAFRESLKSNWARTGIELYMKSVNLDKSVDEAIQKLEKMPILKIRNKFGINGMVCFGYVVLSIQQNEETLFGQQIMAKVFVCLWHESTHYLLRTLCDDYLVTTPRGNYEKLSNVEGGYRMEYILFGTYNYQIWLHQNFIEIVSQEKWDLLDDYKKNQFDKLGLQVRISNFYLSGMELPCRLSWKE